MPYSVFVFIFLKYIFWLSFSIYSCFASASNTIFPFWAIKTLLFSFLCKEFRHCHSILIYKLNRLRNQHCFKDPNQRWQYRAYYCPKIGEIKRWIAWVTTYNGQRLFSRNDLVNQCWGKKTWTLIARGSVWTTLRGKLQWDSVIGNPIILWDLFAGARRCSYSEFKKNLMLPAG